jgi:hypothetical protein
MRGGAVSEHYDAAEKSMEIADRAPATEEDGVMTDRVRYALALAQIHATLAVADALGAVAGRTGGP